MLKIMRYFFAAIITVAGFILLQTPSAQAASECKSLQSKSSCARRDDCVYVGSYKTAKGKKISAYCRSKGGKAKNSKKLKKLKKTTAKKKQAVKKKAIAADKSKAEVKKKVAKAKKIRKTKKPRKPRKIEEKE